jgi:hypothetical protein
MNKINTELYNLFSEPKMFDTTIELMDSFSHFKIELFDKFWNKLIRVIEMQFDFQDWEMITTSNIEFEEYNIKLAYKKEANKLVYFYIECRYIITYGIDYDIHVDKFKKFDDLYEEAKNLKSDKWRMGSLKNQAMPIYREYKNLDFKIDKTYRKILPELADNTAKEVVDEILNSFTKEIQDFIIKYLQKK